MFLFCAEVPILQSLLPTYSDYLSGKTLSDVMMLPHSYQPANQSLLEVFMLPAWQTLSKAVKFLLIEVHPRLLPTTCGIGDFVMGMGSIIT
jgi:hypothetical protein